MIGYLYIDRLQIKMAVTKKLRILKVHGNGTGAYYFHHKGGWKLY
jgi:hypothetical protein